MYRRNVLFTIPACWIWTSSHAFSISGRPRQQQRQSFLDIVRRPMTAQETTTSSTNKIAPGSIVTVDWTLEPVGDFIPEPLFDVNTTITFVLGQGNYLPGLHDLLLENKNDIGETLPIEMDAGWGARNPNLLAELEKANMDKDLLQQIKVGTKLQLANGLKVTVTEMTDASFTVDGNPPLAGATYNAKVKLVQVQDGPSQLEYTPEESSKSNYTVATFALGCFWGGELEFMRTPGVVGTKVGYTQGKVDNPSYQDVCSGSTGHTEAIMVTFDETIVKYQDLVKLAMDRLGENRYLKNQVGNDVGTQYRHGVYFHNDHQKAWATDVVGSYGTDCVTEVLPATKFWDAEEYHQQYLLKGGQSARKGEESTIRCYG